MLYWECSNVYLSKMEEKKKLCCCFLFERHKTPKASWSYNNTGQTTMIEKIFIKVSKCSLCLIYSVDDLFLCVLLNINCCKKCQKSPCDNELTKEVPEVTQLACRFIQCGHAWFPEVPEVITEACLCPEREKKSSLQPEKSTINESFLLTVVSWHVYFLHHWWL